VGERDRIAFELRLEEGFPRDRAAWDALALASGNVFATPEWALAWWERFGRDREVLTASAADADGRLCALAVLYLRTRRPVRVVRFVGHGPADELGPVCAPADRQAAASGLARLLRESGVADVLVGDQLPGALDWADDGMRPRLLARTASPVLTFDGEDWTALLAARSSNLRRQVRRLERRLDDGATVLRSVDDPAELPSAMGVLFALHRERFGPRTGFLATSALEAFHRSFAAAALERGWLRLWLLEVDGRPQAAWYGFRFGRSWSFYQSGRASTARSGSGVLVLAGTVRAALEDGADEYRFLRGGESYKYRWANADPGLATIAAAPTRRGRLALEVALRQRRLSGPYLAAALRSFRAFITRKG
jgi:CelD/BcsL family acetyltransferase involved in cellulose biosynthesis